MKYLLTADIGTYSKGDEVELAPDDGMVLSGVAVPVKTKPKGKKPSGVSDGDDG